MGQTWDNCCLKFNTDCFFEHIQVLRRKKIQKKGRIICRLSEKIYICCRYNNKGNENYNG